MGVIGEDDDRDALQPIVAFEDDIGCLWSGFCLLYTSDAADE